MHNDVYTYGGVLAAFKCCNIDWFAGFNGAVSRVDLFIRSQLKQSTCLPEAIEPFQTFKRDKKLKSLGFVFQSVQSVQVTQPLMMTANQKNAEAIERAHSLHNVPWCEEYELMISGMAYVLCQL